MSESFGQWQSRPRLRAGDAERQQAVARLTEAWRDGRITRDEFTERNSATLNATYLDEIDAQLSDIGPGLSSEVVVPDNNLPVQDSWQSERENDRLPVRMASPDTPGRAMSFALMSGSELTGPWVVPAHHVSIGMMGGTVIDLRDAVFTSAETSITCIAVMGSVEVIVPPEMEVRVTGVGFMGGFGWDNIEKARTQRQPSPDTPVVTVNGVGFMGGVEVTRREYGTKAH